VSLAVEPRDRRIKIVPVRIGLLDQFQFPSSIPLLDLPLAKNGIRHRRVLLETNEFVCPVFFAEAFNDIVAVLPMRWTRLLVTPIYKVPLRSLARMYTTGRLPFIPSSHWIPAFAGMTEMFG
jgi:hypothetical protein